MQQVLKDTAGLGLFFWLIGYIAGMVLFFTPYATTMGWIIMVIFTPVTIVITWWWFRAQKPLSLQYYAGVGVAWALIAVVLDYLFIVQLFRSTTYYALDIYLYYAFMVVIPVAVGLFLHRREPAGPAG